MKLFLDVTRIATRVIGSAPTGIDRVEYAYAKEILGGYKELGTVPVITSPLFSGSLREPVAGRILSKVAAAWHLDAGPHQDAVYQKLKRYLESPLDERRLHSYRVQGQPPLSRAMKQGYYPLRSFIRASTRLRRRLDRSRNQSCCYFNSSHTQLEKFGRFLWTASAGIKCVFFIHDLIPIDFPEFVSPGACARHEGRLRTASKLASGILVNSDCTRRSVEAYLSGLGSSIPRIETVPLGVSERFLKRQELDPPRPAIPYFVAVSTIEPRKNFIFLFSVWRKLIEQMGSKAPRLIIVGHRGWENENVIDVLERSKTLGPFLVEATDLTDAGLASLLTGAQGLIAPSTVEGFGLPVAEALSLGVPVIASDIEAHREVGGKCAVYADVIDGTAWVDAVKRFLRADETEDLRSAIRALYNPRSQADHVAQAISFISSI